MADARDAAIRSCELQCSRIETAADLAKRRILDDVAIAGIDTAAGKHQRTGRELDLIVPHHHEHFDGALAGAQQQDGRGGTRGGNFGRH